MATRRHAPDQIVAKLREAGVELAEGQKPPQVVRKLWITEQTDCRWRQQYNTARPHGLLGYRPPAPEVRPRRMVADKGCGAEHNHALCRWELRARSIAICWTRRRPAIASRR